MEILQIQKTNSTIYKETAHLLRNKVVTEPRTKLSMSPVPSPMVFLAKPENNETNKKPTNTCKEERTESNIKRYKRTKYNKLIFFSMQLNLKTEWYTSTSVLIKHYFVFQPSTVLLLIFFVRYKITFLCTKKQMNRNFSSIGMKLKQKHQQSAKYPYCFEV